MSLGAKHLDSALIGYFVNQYPAVSHAFIRREIRALEGHGLQIRRYAIRPEPKGVVDRADLEELSRTKYIIRTGGVEFFGIFLRQVVLNPIRAVKAFGFALGMAVASFKTLTKAPLYFLEACVLADWSRREDIKHIHVHFGTNSASIALLAKKLGGASYSLTIHGPEEFDNPVALGLREKIRDAEFVVAISQYVRAQLFRWADFSDWKKISVVRCGLDSDFLNCVPTPIPMPLSMVCVGRLTEQKGQLLLLQAMAHLKAEGLPFTLTLVGDGPMRHELEQFIAENNLGQQVRLVGSLSGEGIREELSAARLFVLPSFAEGLPVVIMEAFALGRPVISSFVAGIPELVENRFSGWLIPAGSLEDLIVAIREALGASSKVLSEMAGRGRQKVLDNHDAKREGSKLKALMSEVTERAVR